MIKTTKAEFALFCDMSRKWREKLGLMNWAFYFEHTKTEDAYARTSWSTNAMAATLKFATEWDNLRPKNEHEIDMLALHEVLHVLMAPLISEAEYRYSTQESIDMAEHSIIRSLENIVVGIDAKV